MPQDELRFANHWIGIYDPGNPLRPREASEARPTAIAPGSRLACKHPMFAVRTEATVADVR